MIFGYEKAQRLYDGMEPQEIALTDEEHSEMVEQEQREKRLKEQAEKSRIACVANAELWDRAAERMKQERASIIAPHPHA